MLDVLASVLEFVLTWSATIGVITGFVAVVALTVGAVSRRRSAGAASLALVMLLPWEVYAWALAVAVCVSEFGNLGWWAGVPLFSLWIFVGPNAAWTGLFVAVLSGNWPLARLLTGTCLGILIVSALASVLIRRSRGPVAQVADSSAPLG